jgi:hypothetical protein
MDTRHAFRLAFAGLSLVVAGSLSLPAAAQTASPPVKGERTVKAKPGPTKPGAPVVVIPIPDASPEQVKAAEMVYMGKYDCEFNQTIDVLQSVKYSGYVDLKSGKSSWLMKPVLSSTGAIRLEDVRGETLMVQIAAKSMLLNVKTGHRIVDDCISPKQRELIEAAKAAKASS